MRGVPSVVEYFRSFYYPATYLPPVNLNKYLPEHQCPDRAAIKRAQTLTSLRGVQTVLSDPFSYELSAIKEKNKVLKNYAFRILGEKPLIGEATIPFYNVCKHLLLHGWVIKGSGAKTPKDKILPGLQNDYNETSLPTPFEGLLRLPMNERIRQIATVQGIEIVIPKEYAVPYASKRKGDNTRHYFVLSEKLKLKSPDETVARIAQMPEHQQIELADKMSRLIECAGLADTSFHNFRFTRDGKLTFLDTEPAGLLVAQEDPSHSRGQSVEKCARIGLFNLKALSAKKGLTAFSKEVDRHYQQSLQELSITKIALSIICPLIPLVFLVISAINVIRIYWTARKLHNEEETFFKSSSLQYSKHEVNIKPLKENYFSFIEGVPFSAPEDELTLKIKNWKSLLVLLLGTENRYTPTT